MSGSRMDKTGEGGLRQSEVHNNNERFNQMLNQCKYPRRTFAVLMCIKPSVEQSDDVFEKRKVFIRQLLSGLDIAEGYEQIV